MPSGEPRLLLLQCSPILPTAHGTESRIQDERGCGCWNRWPFPRPHAATAPHRSHEDIFPSCPNLHPRAPVFPATGPTTPPQTPKKSLEPARFHGNAGHPPAWQGNCGPAPGAPPPLPAIVSVVAGSPPLLLDSDSDPHGAPAKSRRNRPSVASATGLPRAVSAPDCAPHEKSIPLDSAATSRAANVGTTTGTIPEQFLPRHAPITPAPANNAKAARATLRTTPQLQFPEEMQPANPRQPAVLAATRRWSWKRKTNSTRVAGMRGENELNILQRSFAPQNCLCGDGRPRLSGRAKLDLLQVISQNNMTAHETHGTSVVQCCRACFASSTLML